MASDTRRCGDTNMTVEKLDAKCLSDYQPDKMSKRRFGKVMRRMGRKHRQESVILKTKMSRKHYEKM